jgi:hypothetical protein
MGLSAFIHLARPAPQYSMFAVESPWSYTSYLCGEG